MYIMAHVCLTAHPNFSTNPNLTALGGWVLGYGICIYVYAEYEQK